MATLYLTEQNAHLRKTSQRLVIERDGETLGEVTEDEEVWIF